MTAALNAWKQAGMAQMQIPAFKTPEERAVAISQFESVAARRVIAAVIKTLESIPSMLGDFLIAPAEKNVYFHNDESRVANWTKMPEGYKPVVLNDEQWKALRLRLFGLAYHAQIKPDFEKYTQDRETKSTHEKIVQGVLLVFKNAAAFKLEKAEEALRIFDEIFAETQYKGTNRNNLLLALSFEAINNSIKTVRDAGLKIETDQPAWEWNQMKIKAIAPSSK
ncbi:MAG: hypothetical protein ACK5MA_04040 [Parachlamydiaceae bacterium]